VQLGTNQKKVAGWLASFLLLPSLRVWKLLKKKILKFCITVDTVNNFADPQARIV
jgi:hypothetical protein